MDAFRGFCVVISTNFRRCGVVVADVVLDVEFENHFFDEEH